MTDVEQWQQTFQASATRAGQWALQYAQTHNKESHIIAAKRPALLQALNSALLHGSEPQTAMTLALILHDRMLRDSLWSVWEPYLVQALLLAQRRCDFLHQYRLLCALGDTQAMLGKWQEAIETLQMAIRLEQFADDDWVLARGRHAECLIYLGRGDEARLYLEDALSTAQKRVDHRAYVQILGQLGRVYMPTGEWASAIECFENALTAAQELDWIAQILSNRNFLGLCYTAVNQYEKALLNFREGLILCQMLSERSGEGVILCNMGQLFLQKGDLAQAKVNLGKALLIHRPSGNQYKIVKTLVALAHLSLLQVDLAMAASYLNEARENMNDHQFSSANVYAGLGKLHAAQGDQVAALDAFKRSHKIFLSIGYTYRASQLLESIERYS